MSDGKSGLRNLWLIVAIAAAPMAASYFVYYFSPPSRSANYGELLPPRPLPDVPLALADGTPFRLSSLKGKWVLVTIDGGSCDAYCEKKLLYLRQLRLTQGKDMDRVERAWIVSDAAPPRAEAVAAYQGTWVIRAGDTGLATQFPAATAVHDHIYVIDPLGNLMMRYARDPDHDLMIKDLKRLLKASRIG